MSWFSELKRIARDLCERPGLREQWAILLAGMSVYPMIVAMVAILVWFGTHPAVATALVVPIFGNLAYGLLALFALVIVALLGIIRKVQATLPNGTGLTVEMDDEEQQNAQK